MAGYMVIDDPQVRDLCLAAVQGFEGGEGMLPATDQRELLDFLALRRIRPGDVRLIVLDARREEFDIGFVRELTGIQALSMTPVVILCKIADMVRLGPILELPGVDVATSTVEIRPRIWSALRYSRALRAEKTVEREMRQVMRREKTLVEGRDALSGLPGPGTYLQFLEREWNRCLRYDWEITLILCTLSGYHTFRATEGDDRGFEILRMVAATVQECAHRAGDLVAAPGEGQIAVVLSETSSGGGQHVASRIHRSFDSMAAEKGLDLTKTQLRLCVGFATERPLGLYRSLRLPQNKPAFEHLIDAARIALSKDEHT